MAIPVTRIHASRVIGQIVNNVVQLQRDMRKNAQAHRAQALAQSVPLAQLQVFIADAIIQYNRRLQWVQDLRNDVVRRQRMIDHLTLMGWTEDDIVDVVSALNTVVIQMSGASKTTYVEIISMCDQIIAFVEAPDSLWPE